MILGSEMLGANSNILKTAILAVTLVTMQGVMDINVLSAISLLFLLVGTIGHLSRTMTEFFFLYLSFCGKRTGIVSMIFLSLYVFLRFLTWRARHSPLFATRLCFLFFVISKPLQD